jgi:hypothetical protein
VTIEKQDEALAEALAERNRLWDELQSRTAQERELEYWRERALEMERSPSWRITAPLRLAMRAAANPVGALRAIARRVRALRGR